MWFDRFFARAELPAGLEDELRTLAHEGTPVFVMRSAGWLNLSFVRWLVQRLGLATLGAALGLGHFFHALVGRRGTLAALRAAVGAHVPSLIFLRRPSVFHAKGVAGANGGEDPFRVLCEMQQTSGRPIFLVPILYVWSRRPQRLKASLLDLVLGSPEAPGTLATSIAFLRNYQRAFVRMGAPIALGEFLAAESKRAGAPEGAADLHLAARKVRGALYYHLSRETRAIVGPPFKSPRRVREEVMRDRALQETITAEAERGARPAAEVARQAERNVKEVAARMSPLFFEFIRPLVIWICTRLYQGIHLDEEGIAEVRQVANRGGLILCPSHKSHMDYVILTLLFYEKGLLPPHVAAGINLAFWPFGAIARWCGGFFIRRSFKGDHLYSAVVRAYVKRLMRDGFPQEFFIEGGRSRTGKLAFPKTGLLAMEVDAWREGAGEDLFFVPVAIDYEKLPEGRSYARELGGGEKKKENVWSLLEARKILRTRHGRIYVQFDRPISLAELTGGQDRPLVVGDRQGDAGHRAFVQSLANRIAYGINRASTITPVGLCAAALLSGTEAITGAELAWRLGLLRRIALEGGGRLPATLADGELDPAAGGPIREALALLRCDGVVEVRGAGEAATYGVPRARRAELDFFRNNVIHHFVAIAIIAAARGARPASDGAGTLEADTRWLSRLFKLEFMYRVGARFETIFAETRQAMAKLEIDGATAASSRAEAFLSQMVVPYADAYRMAALALATWPGGDQRGFVRSALQKAGEEVAAGRIEPEAASKTTLHNAAAWLAAEGAFESPGETDARDGASRLRVSAAWRESRARALVLEIDRFRPPPPRSPS